jgi:nitrogen fixation/metabolism regulation signal transduction histidine kinase
MGLDLTMVKKMIEEYKGEISVKTEEEEERNLPLFYQPI